VLDLAASRPPGRVASRRGIRTRASPRGR